jgi:hypothetical protein
LDGPQLQPRVPSVADFYFADPRLALVPIEHLTPIGMSVEFAALLTARRGWRAAQVALFDAGFSLYWTRSAALARRTATWPAPRLRHVAVVGDALAVRPYSQLLNTSAWLLYASDLDTERAHPEWVAYLLAYGDRMAMTGEVTHAAAQAAAWWLERTDDECRAFAEAATRATRPDAAGFQAIAAGLSWLRRLRHVDLCPPRVVSPHRSMPGTGLLVPQALEQEPPALSVRWRTTAEAALRAYRAAWAAREPAAVAELLSWLERETPPLLVTAEGGRIVWEPEAPGHGDPLRDLLADADAVAVRAIHDDLRAVDRHTRAFLDAVVDRTALSTARADAEQSGYSYLHRERRLIAYNVDERGMERRRGAPLPFARAMLGARTAHEWAHLADAAGWVPRTIDESGWQAAQDALAAALDATIGAAPAAVRARTGADVARLAEGGGSAGRTLVRIALTRLPDYRANLVARRFLDEHERETYVRHNIRTLRPEYPPPELWRMLVRYLYEYQYLGPHLRLVRVADARAFLWQSTWFVDDFVATGVLDAARFDALAERVATLCRAHDVDETRFRRANLV